MCWMVLVTSYVQVMFGALELLKMFQQKIWLHHHYTYPILPNTCSKGLVGKKITTQVLQTDLLVQVYFIGFLLTFFWHSSARPIYKKERSCSPQLLSIKFRIGICEEATRRSKSCPEPFCIGAKIQAIDVCPLLAIQHHLLGSNSSTPSFQGC